MLRLCRGADASKDCDTAESALPGIIGAGLNAVGPTKYFADAPRSQVVTITDPDQQHARALSTEVWAASLTDYQDFLAGVDAAVISSPNSLHHEHAIACTRDGKYISSEKPMGLSQQGAQEIAIAVRRRGSNSQSAFQSALTPPSRLHNT
ncbi:hypothetical protein KDH_09110 [Dictyobacter sp. S3.2.2.5]|uniref:Gfo/Idh/MocA-like oxidoreductase N-terminal domain-containing protein n=1 Tax=Dictyobacter halimunensis TaxID=3026934 RepID=A0ABQ6FNR9_9CHLR|nr:hypothetical protein KDH_09110 [Dictyobacter sp. S3.2.2.5]